MKNLTLIKGPAPTALQTLRSTAMELYLQISTTAPSELQLVFNPTIKSSLPDIPGMEVATIIPFSGTILTAP